MGSFSEGVECPKTVSKLGFLAHTSVWAPLTKAISLFPASGENWIRNFIAHFRIFVFGNIAGGILISPKGQRKCQDRFADVSRTQ